MKGKTLAVTGCCGFIGLRILQLARESAENDIKLKGLDMIPPQPQTKKELDRLQVEFFQGEINDR